MSERAGADRPRKKVSTGIRVPATVPKRERRDVVVRATARVRSARAVDTTTVLRGRRH